MVLYLTRTHGYEGLHAVLLMHTDQDTEGVVVPDPWPEPPEWVTPPTE